MPGDIIDETTSFDSDTATGTTEMPQDTSIPENTEGDQYMSVAHTPKSVMNLLDIFHSGHYNKGTATTAHIGIALFQDSTVNALAATDFGTDDQASAYGCGILFHRMRADTTSETTFKIRAGTNGAGTNSFNPSYGASSSSWITVKEIHG